MVLRTAHEFHGAVIMISIAGSQKLGTELSSAKRPAAAERLRRELGRVLHLIRNRRTLARLRASLPVRSVLFICTGNVYRSPFAARRFEAALQPGSASGIRIGSNGFAAAGIPVPPAATAIALEYGVNLQPHVSCLFDRESCHEWQVIVVMERQHTRILQSLLRSHTVLTICLGDLDPDATAPRSIHDPAGASAETLRGCYSRIARCVDVLAAAVAQKEGRRDQRSDAPR